METCKREREQFITIKEKADEEKLVKVQAYVRQTLMPFDFTDEELFQVSECIVSLVVHGVVVPTLPIKIEKTGKKEQLTQHDLANLSWNIATSTTSRTNWRLSSHSTPSLPGSGIPRQKLSPRS